MEEKKKSKKGQIIGIIVAVVILGLMGTACSGRYIYGLSENDSDVTMQEPEEKQDEPEMTMGQRNALRKAQDYLAVMAFSYTGLIEQLEYEGFSTEEATFAVDNCGADWNEQAAKKAQDYLDVMSFSRSGLIEQLEYEGFTHEQAEYGVTAVGY